MTDVPFPLPARRTGQAVVGIDPRRTRVRVRWLIHVFRRGPQSDSHSHVSTGPPTIPDGRISRVRFWPRLCTPFSGSRSSHGCQRLKRWHAYTPNGHGSPAPSLRSRATAVSQHCVWVRAESSEPPSAQSPFARQGCYPRRGGLRGRLGGRYSPFNAPTGSCASPTTSHRFRLTLCVESFAGCCHPLLVVGPSRHYPRNPCRGDWTHTPPCPPGACTHFFPGVVGLTLRETRSAHESIPAMRLRQGAVFRGCSHSLMFSLPHSLDPPVAPTAIPESTGRPGRLHHASPGELPRPGCGIAT